MTLGFHQNLLGDAMSFKVGCPSCGKQFNAPEQLVGKQVACPSCKQPFVVQPPAAAPDPLGELPDDPLGAPASSGRTLHKTPEPRPAAGGSALSGMPVGKVVKLVVALVLVVGAGTAVFEVVRRLNREQDSYGWQRPEFLPIQYDDSVRGSNPRVTWENYNRLNNQMTLSEVEEILGKADQTQQKNGKVGYRWSNADEHITIEFRGDKMVLRKGHLDGASPSSDGGISSRDGGFSFETAQREGYYYRATLTCPEARQSQPDPEVLARQMKMIDSPLFKDMSTEELLDILKMGREQGWRSGVEAPTAKFALSTGRFVERGDVEFRYSSEVDDHPELAEAEWHDPQLAQEIQASFFFRDFTVTETIDILKLGRELAEQAK